MTLRTLLTYFTFAACAVFFSVYAAAQDDPAAEEDPPVARPFEWRNIGPGNMMGRITSIDALETDHRVVVVGSASGGVWLSRNAGTTVKPIFDDYGTQSIGAVAPQGSM